MPIDAPTLTWMCHISGRGARQYEAASSLLISGKGNRAWLLAKPLLGMVERRGIEPRAFALRTRRSPS